MIDFIWVSRLAKNRKNFTFVLYGKEIALIAFQKYQTL